MAHGNNRIIGHGSWTLAVTLAASGMLSATLQAQIAPEEIDTALERCNRLDDSQARLACLRAIFETEQPARDRPADEPDADAAPRGEDASSVPPERRTVPRGGIDEHGRRDESSSRRRDSERAAPRATDDDFGLPPKIGDRPAESGLSSSVVWYDDVYKIGHPIFVLENGQVWQETEGKGRVEIPTRPPFGISIKKGMFGDFQMKVDGKTGFMRVKRLK